MATLIEKRAGEERTPSDRRMAADEQADEAVWEARYRAFLPRVYNYFRYRLGDRPLVDDLTATTFEKAWRARAQYDSSRATFSTWLFAIARNVASEHFRSRPEHASLTVVESMAGTAQVEQEVANREEVARLDTLLATLPDRERELIALKYGAGLSHRAIARHLDLTPIYVGVIHYRTVRRLRAAWEESE